MGCNVKIMNSYAFEKKNVPQTGPLSIAGGGRNAYRHTHTSTHTCTHTQTHRHRQRHTDTHRHTNKHTHTLTLSKKKKNSLLGPQTFAPIYLLPMSELRTDFSEPNKR